MTDHPEDAALPPFEAEFARAWSTPGHTRYQLPDTDVNEVLATRYTASAPLTFTRTMLWEMEVRKAARPGTYIPNVVQAGSDRSWSLRSGDGGEYLDRYSMQRLWLAPDRYELILERAFLNHREQKITFLGVPKLTAPDGTPLHAGTGQPLFHVEHSTGGSQSRPLNQWRIVHLTEATDDRLTAVFEHMAASPWLAEHTEIYISHDLGIQLTRKHAELGRTRYGNEMKATTPRRAAQAAGGREPPGRCCGCGGSAPWYRATRRRRRLPWPFARRSPRPARPAS